MMTVLKSYSLPFMLTVLLCSGACKAEQTYVPTSESLARHDAAPEWLQDAKLGIYFHWGVYSVPAFGNEWYPHHMYKTGESVNRHHTETWGDPTEFEYPDFIPMFRAEYFDADAWALLFKKAGARFAGPVAEHHDGFAMWNSTATPWNCVNMGPERDITGELAEALCKQDMRLITTFHHARNNLWKTDKGEWTGHYMYLQKNYPSLLEDDKRAILYGAMPRDEFVSMWKGKLIEVIDQYHPDIIWFDSWLDEIPQKDRFEFAAYYLNQAQKRNQDVVIVRKQEDLPLNFSILDHEKSRMSGASEHVWMTDDTISTGSWCYTNNLRIKPAEDIIHATIDTVSKNGIVLLNISPKADGSIPKDQRHVLLELGHWLNRYGEAIYSTRPWKTYGEGPTKEPEGGFSDQRKFLDLKYTFRDIRYTRSKDGNIVYAIQMGLSEDPVTLQAVELDEQSGVSLVGTDLPVSYKINDDGSLTIYPPKPDQKEYFSSYANVYKITRMKRTK